MAEKRGARIGSSFGKPALRLRELFENDTASILKHEMIDDFIAKEFLRVVDDGEEYRYKLSIAIAELLFEFGTDFAPVDGLTYPSLASDEIHANIALRPRAFADNYRATACKRLTIEGPCTKFERGIQIDGFSTFDKRIAKTVGDDGGIEW